MVQFQGCSDEEDFVEEFFKDSGVLEEKDLDGVVFKEDSGFSVKQFLGEVFLLWDYVVFIMMEFFGMFGYDDQNMWDELVRKISFEKLYVGFILEVVIFFMLFIFEDIFSKWVWFFKYEEYICKFKVGEQFFWLVFGVKIEEWVGKEVVGFFFGLWLFSSMVYLEIKVIILFLLLYSSVQVQNLVVWVFKYDFFI